MKDVLEGVLGLTLWLVGMILSLFFSAIPIAIAIMIVIWLLS
jgi:hypothetical protein